MTTGDGRSAEGLLGPLEYDVVRALWAEGAAGVPAVLDRVNAGRGAGKPPLAYTTVMTVLTRLHDKGLLERERRGRGYEYRPRFTEGELVEHLSRQAVGDLLARYGDVALAQFAAAIDAADPALLRRIRELAGTDDA